MTKAGAGSLLTAIIIALSTTPVLAQSSASIAAASAGSQSVQQPAKDQPAPEQSTNQIVKANQKSLSVSVDQEPLEVRSFAPVRETAKLLKRQEPAAEPEMPTSVIPPAPIVLKRNTTAIVIPAEVAGSDSKMGSASGYTERLVLSSGVSVGSSFGYRRDPFTRRAKFHSGVDIKARRGDLVGASQGGTVQFAGWYYGYGNMVIVDHGGGVTTHYAHLTSFDVEVGARVERGTTVGRAGSTGRATSPHLHYEVRIDGNPMNPLQPLALDPSSDYFKQARPTVEAGRSHTTSTAGSQR